VPIWGVLNLIVPIQDGNWMCELLGFYDNFLKLSGTFWTKIFADSLYQMIIKRSQMKINYAQMVTTALIIPLIFASIPLALGYYGASNLNCSFRNSMPGVQQFWLDLLFYFGPVFLIVIYNITVFWKTAIFIRKRFGESRIFYQLLLYPMTVLPMNILTFICRIQISLFQERPFLALDYGWLVLFYLQGFSSSIIYGSNPNVRKEIWKTFCQKKSNDSDSLETPVDDSKLII